MNAMNGSVPAQPDLNWQMTWTFLLTLVLLGFVMKLIALLLLEDPKLWPVILVPAT